MNPQETFRQSLRDQFGDAANAVFTDSEKLRRKADEKFGEKVGDDIWWVTERSLQQSTPWQVAKLKASWFSDSPVADLCCGIGGDAMWLTKRGRTVAVDLDPMLARIAEANCRDRTKSPSETMRGEFLNADAISFARAWDGAVHIDPDRRVGSKRTSTPDYYAPAWPYVAEILSRAPAAIVKLAPAAELDSSTLMRPSHRTWLSLRGSVREQSLLVGNTINHAGLPENSRSAIAIRGDGSHKRFIVEPDSITVRSAAITREPGDWMIDPDAAIRAAGLTEAFANAHGLHVIGSPSGFLTNDPDCRALGTSEIDEAARAMAIIARVEWSGSYDERRLKKEMRSRGVYPTVVKVRGVDRDPVKEARTYRDCGDRPVTLWLGGIGKKAYAAITGNDA